MKFITLTSIVAGHPVIVILERIEAITQDPDLVTQIQLQSGQTLPVRETPAEIVRMPIEEIGQPVRLG